MSRKTYAVDWDGTLVEYDGYKGPGVYGAAVWPMVQRIQQWLNEGHEVIIHTSRVSIEHDHDKVVCELEAMDVALQNMGLPLLFITANKYARISEFWDDRGVRVVKNKGICCEDLGAVQGS